MTFIPLVPNWSTPIKEVFEFNTDIITSRDGLEQRRALRNNPRLTISFQGDGRVEQMRLLSQHLESMLGQTVEIPNFLVRTKTTAALPASGNTVTVADVPPWMTEGATVALCYRREIAVMEIDTIAGMSVTFTTLTARSWPIGTKIRPLIQGRLKRGAGLRFITDHVFQGTINFEVTPGIYSFDDTSDDIMTLGDYEIMTVRPNWGEAPTANYERVYDEVDYGFGRTAFYSPVAYSTRTAQATYTQRSAEQTEWMKRFFLRQKGMRGEFYAPSWTDDMTLLSADSGSNLMMIAGRGVYDAYALSATNRAIWVRLNDNSWKAFEIEVIELVGGNTRLTLTETLIDTILPSQVKQICWLYRSRFASDSLTVEWTTDQVSKIAYQAKSLPV